MHKVDERSVLVKVSHQFNGFKDQGLRPRDQKLGFRGSGLVIEAGGLALGFRLHRFGFLISGLGPLQYLGYG